MLPDACSYLTVHFHERRIAVYMRAAYAAPFRAPCTAGEKIVGLRLRPGAQAAVDFPEFARRLAGKLSPRSFAEAESLVTEAVERAQRGESDRRIAAMVGHLRVSKGSMTISDLAEEIGVTDRHLERLSVNALGLTPKIFARIVRLQVAIREIIACPTQSLADTAATAGYADQSHLRRDFMALGQIAPSEYQRMIRDYRFHLDTQRSEAMSDLF